MLGNARAWITGPRLDGPTVGRLHIHSLNAGGPDEFDGCRLRIMTADVYDVRFLLYTIDRVNERIAMFDIQASFCDLRSAYTYMARQSVKQSFFPAPDDKKIQAFRLQQSMTSSGPCRTNPTCIKQKKILGKLAPPFKSLPYSLLLLVDMTED